MNGNIGIERGEGERSIIWYKNGVERTKLADNNTRTMLFNSENNEIVWTYEKASKTFEVRATNTNLVTKVKDGRAVLTLTADGIAWDGATPNVADRRGNTVTLRLAINRKVGSTGDITSVLPADMRPTLNVIQSFIANDGTAVRVTIENSTGNVRIGTEGKNMYATLTYVVDQGGIYMAKYYGYCYNNEGKYTEMIPLEEKPIYEKQTFYREETKEVTTEEKLCELHQSIQDGTYVPDQENEEVPISKYDCSDCVMEHVEYETIKVPYEEDVVIGYEPDIPANCSLEICPDLIYAPVFKDGKWVKTIEPKPEEPKPQEPSELEKIKQQLTDIQKELEDIKNQKPPTLDEPETPIAFAAPIQDTPDYEHEINKIKQVIPNLGEQIVDLHSRIADLENKEQV